MNLAAWDIDLASGHIAHPSGLHAYIATAPADSGAIRCIGPFSSHKDNLKKKEVMQYTADAIHAIEALEPFRDCFTYWGSIARPDSKSEGSVTILGERFGFIPNPCFRSDLLLNSRFSRATSLDLSREWTYDGIRPQISHRLGYEFSFPQHQERRFCINGQVMAVPDGNLDIQSELRSLVIKSLGGLAMAVLSELGHQFVHTGRRKLRLRLQDQ